MEKQKSALEISNLLYLYCECIDKGDLEGASHLFAHAKLKMVTSSKLQDHQTMLAMLQEVIIIYPDGTPRTKHVLSNPIIEVDEKAEKASSRSYYTVFQATENLPLQVIATGRYFDRFELIGEKWRFSYRDSQTDHLGNVSGHIRLDSALLKGVDIARQ